MYASNAFLHSVAEHVGAEHFPLEIFLCDAKMHFCTAKMHFGIKCICNILLMQKCIFATKCDAKMHFYSIKCICNILLVLNIFLWKNEHFPKENVAFVTFCVTKCDAKMHFCTASNAFVTFC